MRTRGSKSGVKNETPKSSETQECLWENQDFPSPKSNFPRSKFDFLQRLSDFQEIRENLLERLFDFFNGFLLSLTHVYFWLRLSNFPQRHPNFFNGFPIFLNGFPLSKKSGKIYLWQQVSFRCGAHFNA